jgi:hypothetical protein
MVTSSAEKYELFYSRYLVVPRIVVENYRKTCMQISWSTALVVYPFIQQGCVLIMRSRYIKSSWLTPPPNHVVIKTSKHLKATKKKTIVFSEDSTTKAQNPHLPSKILQFLFRMRPTTLLIAAASTLLTSTSALTIPRSAETFNVTNFFASGARFSIATSYSFSVTDGLSSANCSASVSTLPMISFVPVTCCVSSAPLPACNWQFSFGAANTTGFNLNITNLAASGDVETGIHFFPASDVQTVDDPTNPNGDFDFLATPADFVVPVC